MTPVVVDASVVLEAATRGPAATSIRSELAERRPVAPAQVLVEAAEALRVLCRRREVFSAVAHEALGRVLAFPLRLVPVDPAMVRFAFGLRGELSVAEATYVALATELRAPLLTLDLSLRERRLPCPVIVPDDERTHG